MDSRNRAEHNKNLAVLYEKTDKYRRPLKLGQVLLMCGRGVPQCFLRNIDVFVCVATLSALQTLDIDTADFSSVAMFGLGRVIPYTTP